VTRTIGLKNFHNLYVSKLYNSTNTYDSCRCDVSVFYDAIDDRPSNKKWFAASTRMALNNTLSWIADTIKSIMIRLWDCTHSGHCYFLQLKVGRWLLNIESTVGPFLCVSKTTGCLAFSPLCRFAPWFFRPLTFSPLSSFALWLILHLALSPPVPGWFAPWFVCLLASSPPGSFALLPWTFRPRWIPVIRHRGLYVIIVLMHRQFMHDDENKKKRLCKCWMLSSILK